MHVTWNMTWNLRQHVATKVIVAACTMKGGQLTIVPHISHPDSVCTIQCLYYIVTFHSMHMCPHFIQPGDWVILTLQLWTATNILSMDGESMFLLKLKTSLNYKEEQHQLTTQMQPCSLHLLLGLMRPLLRYAKYYMA